MGFFKNRIRKKKFENAVNDLDKAMEELKAGIQNDYDEGRITRKQYESRMRSNGWEPE
jgi:hypothetical protein